tara:strand:- start:20105 stop:21901 length:1797 start_codon:yes stop_codon:yes gene_type:complete
MTNKRPPINLTSRDFESIKQDLVNYAKVYYPETYQDFNQSSFGAMVFDMVSYVGDMLSFYVDYQTNEMLIDSAIEAENIAKLAKQLGYKYPGASTSTGKCAFYVEVPAQSDEAGSQPIASNLPMLKKNTIVTSDGGAAFTLVEDVDFSREDTQIVVGEDDGKKPVTYAYKAYGDVVSGLIETQTSTITSLSKFLEIEIDDTNVTEIISVIDKDGNEYFEVQYLSQNIVFETLRNFDQNSVEEAPYIIKPKLAARRFVVEHTFDGGTKIKFGSGSETSISNNEFPDPASVIIEKKAKEYYTDDTFDPNKILDSDKLGVLPPVGDITIKYRKNTADNVNVPVGSVSKVSSPIIAYKNSDVSANIKDKVVSTLEVENEEQITGQVKPVLAEELRVRGLAAFASQNRAVTKDDYISLIYRMPSKFGAVKRANVVRDNDSFKRNLNIFAVSEDKNGFLVSTPSTVKENLKTWLNHYRVMNDTIDIIDGKVVNIGIEFSLISKTEANTTDVLNKAILAIKKRFENKLLMGTPFYISEIYKLLNDITEVVDTKTVKIVNKFGTAYSDTSYDIESNISADGRFVFVPENTVLELRYPDVDIVGVVI